MIEGVLGTSIIALDTKLVSVFLVNNTRSGTETEKATVNNNFFYSQ